MYPTLSCRKRLISQRFLPRNAVDGNAGKRVPIMTGTRTQPRRDLPPNSKPNRINRSDSQKQKANGIRTGCSPAMATSGGVDLSIYPSLSIFTRQEWWRNWRETGEIDLWRGFAGRCYGVPFSLSLSVSSSSCLSLSLFLCLTVSLSSVWQFESVFFFLMRIREKQRKKMIHNKWTVVIVGSS